MIGLGWLLISLSVGDLVASGLSGEPRSRSHIVAGGVVALVLSFSGGWSAGLSIAALVSLTTISTVVTLGWLVAKGTTRSGSVWNHPVAALWILAAGLAVGLGMSGSWNDGGGGMIDRWYATLPEPLIEGSNVETATLTVATILFLTAPANGIVRAILSAASTALSDSEQILQGGRVIGVLERWLIFWLFAVGDPTAAALVVSAKSLLRFPEISKSVRGEGSAGNDLPARVDSVTEYFLLGSLSSWTITAFPIILF